MPIGKLNHSGSDQLSGSTYSLVDYNRAGQALLEIVSEPDMRSGQDAAAYGAELRRIMVFLGVSDGEMSVSILLDPPPYSCQQDKVYWTDCNNKIVVACAKNYPEVKSVVEPDGMYITDGD